MIIVNVIWKELNDIIGLLVEFGESHVDIVE